MRFTINHLTFEVPEGIDVLVKMNERESDFDFIKDYKIVSMLGGIDKDGKPLPSWKDLGIHRIETYGRLSSGVPVTEEMIEEWADEAERGYDIDQLIPKEKE